LGKNELENLKQFEFCLSSRTILAAFERTKASSSIVTVVCLLQDLLHSFLKDKNCSFRHSDLEPQENVREFAL